jgi:hypothetical protein
MEKTEAESSQAKVKVEKLLRPKPDPKEEKPKLVTLTTVPYLVSTSQSSERFSIIQSRLALSKARLVYAQLQPIPVALR